MTSEYVGFRTFIAMLRILRSFQLGTKTKFVFTLHPYSDDNCDSSNRRIE